ncbi:MAG: hypothetical protein LBT21_00760 [Oscillospiraceae bacterium]|jgi:hypothetical protein|nr:hypothetical protein [Oscillospiraceae bacterium]
MAYGQFLGYAKGEDGKPIIVEEEAAIVRLIYWLFIEGKSPFSARIVSAQNPTCSPQPTFTRKIITSNDKRSSANYHKKIQQMKGKRRG